MSSPVANARARVEAASEKRVVAKHTRRHTVSLKREIIESFLALGLPLETAELLYTGCYQAVDTALAEAQNELNAAEEALELLEASSSTLSS